MAEKNKSDKKVSQKELIKELAELLEETGLSEIEIEQKDLRIRVAKPATNIVAAAPLPHSAVEASPLPAATGAPASGTEGAVTSPMVGTAYRAPEPGKPPFVDIGTKVVNFANKSVTALVVQNQLPGPTIEAHVGDTLVVKHNHWQAD